MANKRTKASPRAYAGRLASKTPFYNDTVHRHTWPTQLHPVVGLPLLYFLLLLKL